MKKSGGMKILVVSLLCLATSIPSWAGFWDWTQPYKGPRRDIVSLIVTANYRDTLLLAQLVQYHTKQPFILLPAKGQKQIFFWPARQSAALEISEKDLSRFIAFLNPQRIIVIGAENVVGRKYLNMIPHDQTVMVIYNENWQKVADALDGIMRAPSISVDFERLRGELNNGALYAPTQDKKDTATEANPAVPATRAVTTTPNVTTSKANGDTVKVVKLEKAEHHDSDEMPKEDPVMIDADK
ncbi:MAG: hypothetical protein PHQ27_09510 [Victivallales bacterium]|nr:hypothetical protein [Victivallales bacterium]